jgi:hypothetical protein
VLLVFRQHRTRFASTLVFVDGLNHLRPEIPRNVVALVDTLVQPINRNVCGAGAVLLDQLTRNSSTRAGIE